MIDHVITKPNGGKVIVFPRGVPFKEAQATYKRAHALFWQAHEACGAACDVYQQVKAEVDEAANDQPTLIATLKREEYRREWANTLLDAATRLLDVARADYEAAGAPIDQHGNPVIDAEGSQPGWDEAEVAG